MGKVNNMSDHQPPKPPKKHQEPRPRNFYAKKQRIIENKVKKAAYKKFIKHLDAAISELYVCDMNNNGAVLSMDIISLHKALKDYKPLHLDIS